MDASDPLCAAAPNARYSIRAGGATAAELRPPATFPSTTPPTRRQARADCHREEGDGGRRIRSPRTQRARVRARAGAREPRQRRRQCLWRLCRRRAARPSPVSRTLLRAERAIPEPAAGAGVCPPRTFRPDDWTLLMPERECVTCTLPELSDLAILELPSHANMPPHPNRFTIDRARYLRTVGSSQAGRGKYNSAQGRAAPDCGLGLVHPPSDTAFLIHCGINAVRIMVRYILRHVNPLLKFDCCPPKVKHRSLGIHSSPCAPGYQRPDTRGVSKPSRLSAGFVRSQPSIHCRV